MSVSRREVRAAEQVYLELAQRYLLEHGWSQTGMAVSFNKGCEGWIHAEEANPQAIEFALAIEGAKERQTEALGQHLDDWILLRERVHEEFKNYRRFSSEELNCQG